MLDHLSIIGEETPHHMNPEELIAAGTGLSPVPCKPVKWIQGGEFVGMTEILLDHLGTRGWGGGGGGIIGKDEK